MPTKWHIQLAALPPTCARKRSEERDPKSEAMYIRLGRPISSAGHKKITHRKMGLRYRESVWSHTNRIPSPVADALQTASATRSIARSSPRHWYRVRVQLHPRMRD